MREAALPGHSIHRGAHRPAHYVTKTTLAAVIVLANVATVAFGATLLWLTAGTTVITGDGTQLTLIFFLCALLHALATVLGHRLARASELTATLVNVVSMSAGVVLLVVFYLVTDLYFAGWIAAFASLFVVASSAASAIVGILMSGAERWLLQLIHVVLGVAGFLITNALWLNNGLLVGLLLFEVGFVLCGRFFTMIFLVAGPTVLTGGVAYRDRRDG